MEFLHKSNFCQNQFYCFYYSSKKNNRKYLLKMFTKLNKIIKIFRLFLCFLQAYMLSFKHVLF